MMFIETVTVLAALKHYQWVPYFLDGARHVSNQFGVFPDVDSPWTFCYT